MSEQTWTPPPEGAVCWIEIPSRDAEKLKASFSSLLSLGTEGIDWLLGFLFCCLPFMGVFASSHR
jgi:hypothetical protein